MKITHVALEQADRTFVANCYSNELAEVSAINHTKLTGRRTIVCKILSAIVLNDKKQAELIKF